MAFCSSLGPAARSAGARLDDRLRGGSLPPTRMFRRAPQDFAPRIYVSDSDFMAITRGGALCRPNGNLGPPEFEAVMREQLRIYSQTRLSSSSEYFASIDPAALPLVTAVKQLLVDQPATQDALARLADGVAAIRRSVAARHQGSKRRSAGPSCLRLQRHGGGGSPLRLRRPCRRRSLEAIGADGELWRTKRRRGSRGLDGGGGAEEIRPVDGGAEEVVAKAAEDGVAGAAFSPTAGRRPEA